MANTDHSSITFHPMLDNDLDQVCKIENLSYSYPWAKGIFLSCLTANSACWVVKKDNMIIGHGVLSWGANESHILNLCIHPNYQRHGFGRQLISHLIKIAIAKQAKVIFLEVRASNTAANNLYTSLGFKQIGFRKDYYSAAQTRENAITMMKTL